jgi:hypothetical protein
VTVHFTLNWVMAGGGAGVIAGVVLAVLAIGLMDASRHAGLVGLLAGVLIVAGIAAFFIGVGMAL